APGRTGRPCRPAGGRETPGVTLRKSQDPRPVSIQESIPMRRSLLLLLFGFLPGCILAIGVDDDEWDGDHSQVRFATWSSHSNDADAGVVSGRVVGPN